MRRYRSVGSVSLVHDSESLASRRGRGGGESTRDGEV